jgi:REP-associated tyrosine transposase
MGRGIRIFQPQISLHIIRRGINRGAIFENDADYEFFLALLEFTAGRRGVDVHVYGMMTNHYHLMVTPRTPSALPEMMRDLGREYVLGYNRKYDRIGTLWSGRYRALAITDERYWLTCLRYIEQNPVRAKMVGHPGDYKWSSYRAHGLGESVPWLAPHPLYLALGPTAEDRQAAYRALCGESVNEAELTRLRHGLIGQSCAEVVTT